MAKYEVNVYVTVQYFVTVEAETEEDAEEKVAGMEYKDMTEMGETLEFFTEEAKDGAN